jgi:hypothetical protein
MAGKKTNRCNELVIIPLSPPMAMIQMMNLTAMNPHLLTHPSWMHGITGKISA